MDCLAMKPTAASTIGETRQPKEQYRVLKKRFKFLVYENECYQEEIRNLQRKLLKLSRDKNFLLDRLLTYEKMSDSSDDSDASVVKVEEKKNKKKNRPAQRRRAPQPTPQTLNAPPPQTINAPPTSTNSSAMDAQLAGKRPKIEN